MGKNQFYSYNTSFIYFSTSAAINIARVVLFFQKRMKIPKYFWNCYYLYFIIYITYIFVLPTHIDNNRIFWNVFLNFSKHNKINCSCKMYIFQKNLCFDANWRTLILPSILQITELDFKNNRIQFWKSSVTWAMWIASEVGKEIKNVLPNYNSGSVFV